MDKPAYGKVIVLLLILPLTIVLAFLYFWKDYNPQGVEETFFIVGLVVIIMFWIYAIWELLWRRL